MARARTRPPAPNTVEDRCVTCGETTVQDVLKGRVVKGGLGVEGTFRCTQCDTIVSGLVRFPAPLHLPLIVSYEAESIPASIEVPEDAELAVGEGFMVDEEQIELTGIELQDEGRRVTKARAGEIRTLWGKNQDRIKVKFGLNEGEITHAFETWFGPEDEVHVGETFDMGDEEVVVDRIVTTEGKKTRGGWNVRLIKRVWLRRAGAGRDDRPRAAKPAAAKERKPQDHAASGGRPASGRPSAGGRSSGTRGGGRPSGRSAPPRGRGRGRPSSGGSGRGGTRRTGQGPTGRR